MAFVPRLPTWNLPVQVIKWNPETELYYNGTGITGQLYTFKRVAEVLGIESMYFVYPKERPRLKGPSDYGTPVGTLFAMDFIYFTTRGEFYFYGVQQSEPRWTGFPNQHWMAALSRTTIEYWQTIQDNMEAPPEPPAFPDTLQLSVGVTEGNGTCTDCSDLNSMTTLTRVYPDSFYYLSDVFHWDCIDQDVIIYVGTDGTDVFMHLVEYPGMAVAYAIWTGDFEAWDGVSDIPMTLSSDSENCDWVENIDLEIP